MQRRIIKELLRRPTAIGALTVLALLYLSAIFAGFLAPYAMSEQDLSQTYHPPTKVFWQGGISGGLRVQAYERTDPSTARYEPIEGQSYRLGFFVEGFEYRLLGLLPLRTHLFGVAPLPPAETTAEMTAGSPATADAPTAGISETSAGDSEATALQPQPSQQTQPQPRVYLMGSDSTGRDVFSRLLYGSRISLTIGLIGISITMLLGFLIGGFSGYFGGSFDFISMRLVEFLMAVPGLYLLLALRSALAPHFVDKGSDMMFLLIVAILALVSWAGTARIVRGLSLSLSRQQFVLAAESMGQRPIVILFRHILPNLASYLLVAATLAIPAYILGEAALSFLGLGIQEPATSWGLMLSQAQDIKVFYLNFWWLLTPGAAILITVMAFNILGDNLREIVSAK